MKKSGLILAIGLAVAFVVSVYWLCLINAQTEQLNNLAKVQEEPFFLPITISVCFLVIFISILTLTYNVYSKERKYEARTEKKKSRNNETGANA